MSRRIIFQTTEKRAAERHGLITHLNHDLNPHLKPNGNYSHHKLYQHFIVQPKRSYSAIHFRFFIYVYLNRLGYYINEKPDQSSFKITKKFM